MKAIWRAFSQPGLKRSRGDDPPDLDIPGSKRAKSEHSKIMKNVDINVKGDATQPQIQIQPKPNISNSSPASLTKPEPKEEREGIFSSLPLTFFSPSVPQSTINQFIKSGGLTLPRLDPMELQYYFKSPLNEEHPFYDVGLIFITGPDDLLGIVLRSRVVVYYDCKWVEKCVERGELLGLGGHVVEFLIKAEVEGGEADDELNVVGDQVSRPPINNKSDISTSRLHDNILSDRPTSETSLPKSDNLLRYAVRTVPPSAFTSESALRNASFHPNISTSTSVPRFRATPTPITRSRLPTPMNAVAGPSDSKDESESQEIEQAFIPFDSSSQRMPSSRSMAPLLYIPYKNLDQVKVMEFEKRVEGSSTFHELEEFYQVLMNCGKVDQVIMGLEAGLLR